MTAVADGVAVVDDEVSAFLDAECELDPHARIQVGELLDRWNRWRIGQGRPALTRVGAGRRLRAHFASVGAVEYSRSNGGTFYRGLKLKTED